MTCDEARELLDLSRQARWTFPSSSGRPISHEPCDWIGPLLDRKTAFVDAARALLDAGDAGAAMEMAANVWRLWILSRDIAAGRAFLADVLDAGPGEPTRFRALALYGDGLLAFWQGAHEDSRRRNEAAVAAARATGDLEALALGCLGMSRVALSDRDPERARACAIEAREHARKLSPAMGQAPLHMHAQSMWLAGDCDEAAALFAESLDLNRRLGDRGMVVVELHNLGHVEVRRGRIDEAERLFEECARSSPSDDPFGTAMGEVNLATLACARGDTRRARDLLASAESRLGPLGADPADEAEIRWLREQLARGPREA